MNVLKQRRINTAIFAILGAIIGYASFLIDGRVESLAMAVVVLVVALKVVQKAFKITEKKWWSSPAALYIFTWIVVWTIFFNIYVIYA